jgi:ketosteroid isomerase-like protein
MDDDVEIVRRLYRAFAAGDRATLAELFADDVEMVQVGRNALAGAFHGRDALFGHFADVLRHADGLDMMPDTLLADGGEHVAALNRMTIRKGGSARAFRVIHLFRIVRGQVAELRSIPEDPYALDDYVGGAS